MSIDSSTLQHYLKLALEEAGVRICGDMHLEISDILKPVENQFNALEKRISALEAAKAVSNEN